MEIITKYLVIHKIDDDKHILINTLNSAMDIVDDATRNKIEDMQCRKKEISSETDAELYGQLKRRGYLYASQEEENNVLERMRQMDIMVKQKLKRVGFTICPTMGCNLRCTYCFESDKLHNDFTIMTEEQVQSICEYILKEKKERTIQNPELDKINPIQIKLFGGEPLLKCNRPVVEKLMEFAAKNNIRMAIITNGTTIHEYKDLLKQYSKIISIQITVDGPEEIHNQRRIRANGAGTFKEICENINLVLGLGITVQFRINVDKENIYHLNELETVVKEKGWRENSLFIPYASPVLDFCGDMEGALKEHELYRILIEEGYYGKEDSFIKRIVSPCIGYIESFFSEDTKVKPWKTSYCEATSGGELCFSPDGLISTCLTYVGKKEIAVGNFDSEAVKIDEEKLALWSQRNVFRIEKCRQCKYAFLCGGGCPVMALERNCNIDCCVCSDIEATIKEYIEHRFK